jgi:TRAP-type uncharacterized transport system fused permease subunit
MGLGLPNYVAHLFAFYYSCLALITPPDATAAYTAASIAGSDGWKTGWLATRMAAVAFIIPIFFAYNHGILLVGPWYILLRTLVAAPLGILCLAVGLGGDFERQLKRRERGIFLVAALLLLAPSWLSVFAGACGLSWLLVSTGALEAFRLRRRIGKPSESLDARELLANASKLHPDTEEEV